MQLYEVLATFATYPATFKLIVQFLQYFAATLLQEF